MLLHCKICTYVCTIDIKIGNTKSKTHSSSHTYVHPEDLYVHTYVCAKRKGNV